MKIQSSRFELAAFREQDEPRLRVPSVVFLGRSNVGKSSLINKLLGTSGLARTSSTPGRTQSVNFYRINENVHFIDLPGYGYAKVPAAIRRQWGPMVESFLERRRDVIVLAVLVVDARHEPSPLDHVMREWVDARSVPSLVAVTKADKLSGNGRAKAARVVTAAMQQGNQDRPVLLVSAETGLGVREMWRYLDRALEGARGNG